MTASSYITAISTPLPTQKVQQAVIVCTIAAGQSLSSLVVSGVGLIPRH